MRELIEQLELYRNKALVRAETEDAGTMTEIGANYFLEQD
jgi:hypothetical protein